MRSKRCAVQNQCNHLKSNSKKIISSISFIACLSCQTHFIYSYLVSVVALTVIGDFA